MHCTFCGYSSYMHFAKVLAELHLHCLDLCKLSQHVVNVLRILHFSTPLIPRGTTDITVCADQTFHVFHGQFINS